MFPVAKDQLLMKPWRARDSAAADGRFGRRHPTLTGPGNQAALGLPCDIRLGQCDIADTPIIFTSLPVVKSRRICDVGVADPQYRNSHKYGNVEL